MTLYWVWLRTIQDNWGFLIVLFVFILWTLGIVLATRLIVKHEVLATEQERYPEKIKSILSAKDKEIQDLTLKVEQRDELIETLKIRNRAARALAVKIPEVLEGLR